MKWYNKPIPPRTSNIIAFSIIAPVTIALLVLDWREKHLIDECPRFTIGYGMTVSGDGKSLNYRYVVKEHTYIGTWGQKPRSWSDYWQSNFVAKNFLYERFLVRFNCKQPKVNRIDWSRSIPDTITAAPYEGWPKLTQEFAKTEFAD